MSFICGLLKSQFKWGIKHWGERLLACVLLFAFVTLSFAAVLKPVPELLESKATHSSFRAPSQHLPTPAVALNFVELSDEEEGEFDGDESAPNSFGFGLQTLSYVYIFRAIRLVFNSIDCVEYLRIFELHRPPEVV